MKKIRNGYLGIILARGGSKGLPNKNLLNCNGKPLIEWTIIAAVNSNLNKIIVSSDNDEILKIGKKYPNVILDKRPSRLAEDFTSSEEVITYILQKYDILCDNLVLLQPTSPCRLSHHINDALIQFSEQDSCDCLISTIKVSNKYLKSFIKVNNKAHPIGDNSFPFVRRQDLPMLYMSNGAIYIASIKYFTKKKSLFSPERTVMFEMNRVSSIDIDTLKDLELASKC